MLVAKEQRADALGRPVTSVQVTVAAQEALRKACQQHKIGLSMGGVASNLLFWWSKQPPHIRTAFADGVDEGMESAYADALERLAAKLRGSAGEPAIGLTAADARVMTEDELAAVDRLIDAEKARRNANKPELPTGVITANQQPQLLAPPKRSGRSRE